MKNLITLIALLITSFLFSQSGINYKAIIKDGSGNILASQSVDVQFIIFEGAVLTNNVYQESHTANTDASGIIIVNIGEGTVNSGDFSIIDWGSDDHFLNVKFNTGSGLIDMGTTQFGTVPYALSVKDAPFKKVGNLVSHPEQDDFLFGVATLDHQSGLEKKIFFDHSKGAFRAGIVNDTSWDEVNVGYASTAFGLNNESSGTYTSAIGRYNKAMANYSVAIGSFNVANGGSAIALGNNLKADAAGSTVMGRYNIGGGSPNSIVSFESLLEVGNGNSVTPSNAFRILNNGTITAPSFDLSEITDAKALITKEYIDNKIALEAIDEGNGVGYRLKNSDPVNYGNIGLKSIDFSDSSSPNELVGATGLNCFAVGLAVKASNNHSAAFGRYTTASNQAAFAANEFTTASGKGASAFGYRTQAQAVNSFVIGRYNVGGGDPTLLYESNPLFEIGIGTSLSNRKNVFTVLQGGQIGIGKHTDIDGMLEIEGNSTFISPQLALIEDNASFARLKFKNTNRNGSDYWDIAGFIGTEVAEDRLNFFNSFAGKNIMSIEGNGDVKINGQLKIESFWDNPFTIFSDDDSSIGMLFLNENDHFWRISSKAGETESDSSLSFYSNFNGFSLMALHASGDLQIWGTLSQYSDRRLKSDIETIDFGIAEILKLNPVQYNRKDKEKNPYKSLGVIAQEIEEIIPNVVTIGNDENQMLSVSYIELIPVLIKAIQEQQEIINSLQTTVGSQQSLMKGQDSKIDDLTAELNLIQSLTQRVNQIESALKILK